jgi:hypothetical protein
MAPRRDAGNGGLDGRYSNRRSRSAIPGRWSATLALYFALKSAQRKAGETMKFHKITLFIAGAALMLPVIANAGPQKAGKWQITTEMKMAGMDMKMPAMTIEHCVTPEEAQNPQPPKGKNDSCRLEDYKLDGSTVTYKIKCDKPEMTGEGKITYSAESYEGSVHMTMKDPRSGEPMEMSQKMTGKLIGECAKTDK